MHTIRPHFRLLVLLVFITSQSLFSTKSNAQVGCPGCNVSLPVLPADTIYLSDAPDGIAGQYYDTDISFRLPKTTTPVNATDPSTPAGLPISSISIVAVVNVPPGLSWQPSQITFNPSNQTDGCVKFCGTPLQPGLYNVEVFVNAEVLTLNQSTSFSFPIFIAPAVSNSTGFSMQNNSGCGEVAVSFQNNLPSNNNPGFTYTWDFGNGTSSSLENPAPVTYSTPGVYVVNYEANIDTFGYEVTTVRVLSASCDDIAINTKPDLYVKIKDPQGNFVVITEVQDNAAFPAIFNVNLPLGDGIYELEVRDEDTFGSESCGYINFTKTNTGIQVSGDLEVQIDVIHPVQTVESSGTVTVFAQPAAPVIVPDGTVALCAGEEIELVSDYDENLQWYQDTSVLFGSIYQSLTVNNAGLYWLEYTSTDGCKAQSELVEVVLNALPYPPVFQVIGNEYSLQDPTQLPANYALQWYMDGNALLGETGPVYCLMEPGVFLMGLEVTDIETGCSNQFSLGVSYNPAYTCASGSDEIVEKTISMSISPNPTNGIVNLDLKREKTGLVMVQIFDAMGKMVFNSDLNSVSQNIRQEFDLRHLANGVYSLKVQTADGIIAQKLVKQ